MHVHFRPFFFLFEFDFSFRLVLIVAFCHRSERKAVFFVWPCQATLRACVFFCISFWWVFHFSCSLYLLLQTFHFRRLSDHYRTRISISNRDAICSLVWTDLRHLLPHLTCRQLLLVRIFIFSNFRRSLSIAVYATEHFSAVFRFFASWISSTRTTFSLSFTEWLKPPIPCELLLPRHPSLHLARLAEFLVIYARRLSLSLGPFFSGQKQRAVFLVLSPTSCLFPLFPADSCDCPFL